MSYENNYGLLKLAAELLGNLSKDLVFVGGSTTCLYVDPEMSDDLRPTEDVDCVIQAYSMKEYNKLEKELRAKGFVNDTRKNAPICRFVYGELLILDVMPDNKDILGFSNSWYKPGIENKILVGIGEYEISIFSLPYFLASKFEAFEGRGKNDPRFSTDLEDIVTVIDGVREFKLGDLSDNLSSYLSDMSKYCLSDLFAQEAINGFLGDPDRVGRLNERLKGIESLRL